MTFLGGARPSQKELLAPALTPKAFPGGAPPTHNHSPTCDGVLNEAQHCAWFFINVEADGIVFLWDFYDEVGVPIH